MDGWKRPPRDSRKNVKKINVSGLHITGETFPKIEIGLMVGTATTCEASIRSSHTSDGTQRTIVCDV